MAISGYVINGGRKVDFFTVTVGSTQTTLASTTPVYTCTQQISTDAPRDDNGARAFSISQIQSDSTFFSFVETYAPSGGAGAAEDLTMEDGENILGASSVGTTLGFLVRGALISGGTDDAKRMSYGGLCKVSKTSGGINFSGNTYNKPSIVFNTTAITQDLVFPSAVLASYMVTAATTTILATTHAHGKVIVG